MGDRRGAAPAPRRDSLAGGASRVAAAPRRRHDGDRRVGGRLRRRLRPDGPRRRVLAGRGGRRSPRSSSPGPPSSPRPAWWRRLRLAVDRPPDRPRQRPPRPLLGGARAVAAGQPRRERAAMAHVLTDEAFALSLVHFRRLGFADRRGYWLAAIGGVFIPWNLATLVGYLGGAGDPGSRGAGARHRLPGRHGRAGRRPGDRAPRGRAARGRRRHRARRRPRGRPARRASSPAACSGPAARPGGPAPRRGRPGARRAAGRPGRFARPDRSEDGMVP